MTTSSNYPIEDDVDLVNLRSVLLESIRSSRNRGGGRGVGDIYDTDIDDLEALRQAALRSKSRPPDSRQRTRSVRLRPTHDCPQFPSPSASSPVRFPFAKWNSRRPSNLIHIQTHEQSSPANFKNDKHQQPLKRDKWSRLEAEGNESSSSESDDEMEKKEKESSGGCQESGTSTSSSGVDNKQEETAKEMEECSAPNKDGREQSEGQKENISQVPSPPPGPELGQLTKEPLEEDKEQPRPVAHARSVLDEDLEFLDQMYGEAFDFSMYEPEEVPLSTTPADVTAEESDTKGYKQKEALESELELIEKKLSHIQKPSPQRLDPSDRKLGSQVVAVTLGARGHAARRGGDSRRRRRPGEHSSRSPPKKTTPTGQDKSSTSSGKRNGFSTPNTPFDRHNQRPSAPIPKSDKDLRSLLQSKKVSDPVASKSGAGDGHRKSQGIESAALSVQGPSSSKKVIRVNTSKEPNKKQPPAAEASIVEVGAKKLPPQFAPNETRKAEKGLDGNFPQTRIILTEDAPRRVVVSDASAPPTTSSSWRRLPTIGRRSSKPGKVLLRRHWDTS